MLLNVEQISQPYSGEYEEKIYDIESNWNSSDWTWIRFEEDSSIWCGEFRGKYIGVMMPISVRLNHAIADGYLVANVFRLLDKEMSNFVN